MNGVFECASRTYRKRSGSSREVEDTLRYKVQHFFRQPRIHADPEHMVHHIVGVGQTSNHAILAAVVCRLASQVPSKQEPGADLLRLKGARQLKATDRCALPDADGKTEPAWVRAPGRFRENQQVLEGVELASQIGKIRLAARDKPGQLGELRSSESSLHIRGLQVVPDVRIGVLVIIAAGQGT